MKKKRKNKDKINNSKIIIYIVSIIFIILIIFSLTYYFSSADKKDINELPPQFQENDIPSTQIQDTQPGRVDEGESYTTEPLGGRILVEAIKFSKCFAIPLSPNW